MVEIAVTIDADLWTADSGHVIVSDGPAGRRAATITATGNHPFWIVNNAAWSGAIDLNRGDLLLTSNGTHAQVAGLAVYSDSLTVYNLTVASAHTYYVPAGDTPVLVHNSCFVQISKGRWDHIWDRHVNRTMYPNKSKFNTTNKAKIERMINQVSVARRLTALTTIDSRHQLGEMLLVIRRTT